MGAGKVAGIIFVIIILGLGLAVGIAFAVNPVETKKFFGVVEKEETPQPPQQTTPDSTTTTSPAPPTNSTTTTTSPPPPTDSTTTTTSPPPTDSTTTTAPPEACVPVPLMCSNSEILAAAKEYYEAEGQWAGVFTIEFPDPEQTNKVSPNQCDIRYKYTQISVPTATGFDQRRFTYEVQESDCKWKVAAMDAYMSGKTVVV